MRIHIISTINGLENEGMRNIAAHLSRELAREHELRHSGLRQPMHILAGAAWGELTLVFARANRRVYALARAVEKICPRLWLVCVQRPDEGFRACNARRSLRCGYLALRMEDLAGIRGRKERLLVGIDAARFAPVSAERARELKAKHGFSPERALIAHVGHCSAGRGLEAFLALDGGAYERLVVASGMFEDAAVAERLHSGGVRVHRGYMEDIEEVYQMADAYLFPTRSGEFVISTPLSVMEALSCGTPVAALDFPGMESIAAAPGAIFRAGDVAGLGALLPEAVKRKGEKSLLECAPSWREAARELMRSIGEEAQ